MPQVPVLEQQVSTQGLPSARRSGFNFNVPNVDNSALFQSRTNLSKAVKGVMDEAKARGDQVAVIDAQRRLDEWEAENIFSADTGALARKGSDAFDLPNTLTSKYDDDMQLIVAGLANDDQRLAFQKIANARRDQIRKTLFSHERDQMNAYANEQAVAGISSAQNRAALYYNNEAVVEQAIRSAQAVAITHARVQGLPEETINNQVLDIESNTRLGVLGRLADNNTAAAMEYFERWAPRFNAGDLGKAHALMEPVMRMHDARNAVQSAFSGIEPVTSQAEMISFIIDDLEGGGKVAKEPDGSFAMYGINSGANPDLAEKIKSGNLTREEAVQRHTEKYWPTWLNDLPVDLRLVAADMYFNGWDKDVLKMDIQEAIESSGYDARRLMEFRAKYYESLAKGNPDKFASSLNGWMGRLGKMNNQLQAMRGRVPTEFEVHQRINSSVENPDTAAAARELASAQIKALKDAKDQIWKEANEEAWQYLNDGREVPPSVQARMRPQDVATMMNTGEPDPALYEDLRARIIAGDDVDLEQYRWRLRGKYDELAEIKRDPKERANARNIDDVLKNAQGVILGYSSPKQRSDFEKIEQFRRTVFEQIDVLQRQVKRDATPEEVQKIVDRMLLNVKSGGFLGFGGSQFAFELQEDEEFTIKGVPRGFTYYTPSGDQIFYDELVNWAMEALETRGLPVNEEGISDLIQGAIRRNELVQKEQ